MGKVIDRVRKREGSARSRAQMVQFIEGMEPDWPDIFRLIATACAFVATIIVFVCVTR